MLIGPSNLLQSVTMRPVGPHAGSGASVTWTATGNPASQDGVTSSGTGVTFSAINIGTAAADRIVVVIFTSQLVVATAMTIGGVSATKAIEESTVISGLQIWYATVTTGTTADVVVTGGGADWSQKAIIVGQIIGATGAPATASSTDVTDPADVTITVPSGGVAIVAYYGTAGGTWTNASFDFDEDTGDSLLLTSANRTTAGSQTPTYTTGGANVGHMVAAAWGP